MEMIEEEDRFVVVLIGTSVSHQLRWTVAGNLDLFHR